MELYGELVKHKVFGKGQIVKFVDNYLTVLFEENKIEKKFSYPEAIGSFLQLENHVLSSQIEDERKEKERIEAEKKRAEEQQDILVKEAEKASKAKPSKSTKLKIAVRSNIAFKCNYCDGGQSTESVGYKGVCSYETVKYNIEVAKHVWCRQPENMCSKYLQGKISRKEICNFYEKTKTEFSKSVCYESQMLEIWNAGAGVTQNGDDKGKPMSLKGVKANSLALLTTKLPNAEDEDRFIFAVFLIDESYEGDNKDEGYVSANPKYRIQLSLEEAKKLKFWDYYFNPNKPEKIIFGSGLHRYLTDIQSAQVLEKICEIKKGTPMEKLAKELFEHYCKIKGLDATNIPKPEGAKNRAIS